MKSENVPPARLAEVEDSDSLCVSSGCCQGFTCPFYEECKVYGFRVPDGDCTHPLNS